MPCAAISRPRCAHETSGMSESMTSTRSQSVSARTPAAIEVPIPFSASGFSTHLHPGRLLIALFGPTTRTRSPRSTFSAVCAADSQRGRPRKSAVSLSPPNRFPLPAASKTTPALASNDGTHLLVALDDLGQSRQRESSRRLAGWHQSHRTGQSRDLLLRDAACGQR